MNAEQYQKLIELEADLRVMATRIDMLEKSQIGDEAQFLKNSDELALLNKKYEQALMYLETVSTLLKWAVRGSLFLASVLTFIKTKSWIAKIFD